MYYTQANDDNKGFIFNLVNLLFYGNINHQRKGLKLFFRDEIKF
jgi:hypothetical protein